MSVLKEKYGESLQPVRPLQGGITRWSCANLLLDRDLIRNLDVLFVTSKIKQQKQSYFIVLRP